MFLFCLLNTTPANAIFMSATPPGYVRRFRMHTSTRKQATGCSSYELLLILKRMQASSCMGVWACAFMSESMGAPITRAVVGSRRSCSVLLITAVCVVGQRLLTPSTLERLSGLSHLLAERGGAAGCASWRNACRMHGRLSNFSLPSERRRNQGWNDHRQHRIFWTQHPTTQT